MGGIILFKKKTQIYKQLSVSIPILNAQKYVIKYKLEGISAPFLEFKWKKNNDKKGMLL